MNSIAYSILLCFNALRLSLLNYDFNLAIVKSTQNKMVTSFLNEWVWLEAIFDLAGLRLTPKECLFGIMPNLVDYVEVLFYPEVPTGERPTMSFLFSLDNAKYCCDATVVNITMTKMTCKQFQVYIPLPNSHKISHLIDFCSCCTV